MEDVSNVINAIANLFNVLVENFGSAGSVIILFILVVAFYSYRLYIDKRKDKYIQALLKEKDRTIQRIAEQERNYRVLFLKEKGMSDDEIERFVIRNDFSNIPEARKNLEENNSDYD